MTKGGYRFFGGDDGKSHPHLWSGFSEMAVPSMVGRTTETTVFVNIKMGVCCGFDLDQ